MKNVIELREELINVFEKIKSKEIDLKQAKELTNVAGKIINSAKLELEYDQFLGNKSKIKFLQK